MSETLEMINSLIYKESISLILEQLKGGYPLKIKYGRVKRQKAL